MILRIVLFLWLAFILAACSPAADGVDPTAVITGLGPTPSLTAVVLPPTVTSFPTATHTPTQTPIPTIAPTSIPSATIRPTRTPIPPPTLAPSATPDIAATFEAVATPSSLGRYPSPDGRFLAEIFRYECTQFEQSYEEAYEFFRLTAAAGESTVFADQPQSCGGLGAGGLQGYFWSEDGRYFYYGTAREGVPDGCGYFAPPYNRLDTADRTTAYLGYGALSPDGTMLALWSPGEALVVYAINGDELGRVPITGSNRVQNTITWSPDGRALVFVLTSDYCPEGASTLTRLDLPELEPLVLREDDPGFAYAHWLDDERLELSNVFGDTTLVVGAVDGEPAP